MARERPYISFFVSDDGFSIIPFDNVLAVNGENDELLVYFKDVHDVVFKINNGIEEFLAGYKYWLEHHDESLEN